MLMTLWAIFRSPLMFGGDLPSNDAWTLSLITNREILAVNQSSLNNRELFNRGTQIAWVANVPGSKEKYVALFNLGDGAAEMRVGCREIGLQTDRCQARDLWQATDLGVFQNDIRAKVNSHGAVMLRVKTR